jgi:hypothetical protein
MVKSQIEFTQNPEPAMQVASVGINRFRQVAEQNFKHGAESLGELFNVNRKIVDTFGNHASAICDYSVSLAEETLSNTLACGVKLLGLREPQELVQVHTDFVSRQAQAIADQTKELNERLMKGADALASSLTESTRRPAKAA